MKKIILTFALCSICVFSYAKPLSTKISVSNTEKFEAKKIPSDPVENKILFQGEVQQKPACRMSCTVSVYDPGTGQWYGATASAGSIFTSCATALHNACEKVQELIQKTMNQMQH